MKILIIGAGKVGTTITGILAKEGHDITLVDKRSDILSNVQSEFDINIVEGNGASLQTLKEAGAKEADIVIAVTNADEANLLTCVTCKSLNENVKCIARIRDPEYVDQARDMADVYNLALVLNPERQAAHEIASLLKMPGILNRENFAKAGMEMVEVKITKDNPICDKPLYAIPSLLHTKVLVCVVERGDMMFIPGGDFVIQEGDKIYVTGEAKKLLEFLYGMRLVKKNVKNVFITGGGRISYYLAKELHGFHIRTTIIEADEHRCEELSSLLEQSTIIKGDAGNMSLLKKHMFDKYDALVSCTGLDELNIVVSMQGSLLGIPLTVTKLGRNTSPNILNNLPIGPLVCPKDLCTDHIVRYVRAMHTSKGAADSVHQLAENAEALEFTVEEDTKYIGKKFKDVKIKKNVLIATVTRGSTHIIADGDVAYEIGDTVIVVATGDRVILHLNDIFEA